MKTLTRRVVLLMSLVLLIDANLVWAQPLDDPATCAISITVSTIMEWAGDFAGISLTAISSQGDTPEGSQMQTLYTNCNLQISADTSTAARLSSATDILTTKYKLSYDGDGSTTGTGGTDVATWTDYSIFLSTPSAVTHMNTDGAVNITLSVQASNPGSRVADWGSYIATQTLTAHWTSD